jgi:hypothetical protein
VKQRGGLVGEVPQPGRVGRSVGTDRAEPGGLEALPGLAGVEALEELARALAAPRCGARGDQLLVGEGEQGRRAVGRPVEQARDPGGQVADQVPAAQAGIAGGAHAAASSSGSSR